MLLLCTFVTVEESSLNCFSLTDDTLDVILIKGKRISLISKKNIRYEGVLYSINEQNATVALQNVRTFGTEGRETSEQGCIFVAPTETVHPYLLFRGQDIKDLHVHESAQSPAAAEAPSKKEAKSSVAVEKAPPAPATTKTTSAKAKTVSSDRSADENKKQPSVNKGATTGGGGYNRRQRSQKAAVGTGASLLNRSVRGAVSGPSETPQGDFDFQSSLEQFQKEGASDDDEEEAGDDPTGIAYAKDDFFDSISCDALDKQSGVHSRVRGSSERHLNTETFGAVALNTQRRRRGRGGGRGRGRYGGRGRGRSRGGRGRGSYRSNASSNQSGSQHASAAVS